MGPRACALARVRSARLGGGGRQGAAAEEGAAARAPGAALLDERGIGLQGLQGLLQALDLGGAAAHCLIVGLHLAGAIRLDAAEILDDGVKLVRQQAAVPRQFGSALVQLLRLLGLELDVLLHGRFLDLVLVGRRLVVLDRRLLFRGDLGEVLREVGLDGLEKTDDASRAARRRVLRRATVVVVEDLEGLLDAIETCLQLGARGLVGGLLRGPHFVHLRLALDER
mmetsp:Transcript_90500/g.230182  ORF Transcript_90500/g.230182 Transcript_90500/m.230182 type:complete len:225 (-) Transcript_90500:1540-2214(-)